MIFIRAFLFTLLICTSISAKAQQLNFTNYSVNNGLPQSQIFDITESKDGKLIIATHGGGVSFFDGLDFKTLNKRAGLKSNNINCLHVSDDTLFIGTDRGIEIYLKGKIIQSISSSLKVTSFLNLKNQFWIGTEGGLFKIKNNKLIAHNNLQLKNKNIVSSFTDNKNQDWICTNQGVFHTTDPFKTLDNNQSKLYVTSSVSTNNKIYLGTLNKGLIVLNKNLQFLPQPEELKHLIITTVYTDKLGTVWVGTQNKGLFKIKNKRISNYSTQQGLANNHIKSVYEDSWGQIWIGTSGGGMSKYAETQFVQYNKNTGLNGNYIYDVAIDNFLNIWTSTANGGLIKVTDSSNILFTKPVNIGKVRNLVLDKSNTLWFSDEGKGLKAIVNVNEKDTVINYNKVQSNWILDMDIAKGGSLWLATADKGLIQTRISYDTIPVINPMLHKRINSKLSKRINIVKISPTNEIWLVDSKKGLAYYNGKNITFIEQTQKLNIREIAFFKTKTLLATDQGIVIIENLKASPFLLNKELTSENIYQILIENDSTIWLGSEQGLDKITSPFLNTYNISHFGAKEGFRGLETSNQCSFKDIQGNLWFGTVRGLEKHQPLQQVKQYKVPKLKIESVIVDYAIETNKLDTVILNYNSKRLEVSVSALDLSNPKDLYFSYKLSGLDDRWSIPSKNNSIVFNTLPAGNYTLLVKAGVGENWSAFKKVQIKVVQAYYTTWWFIIGSILFGLIIVTAIIYFSIHRLRKRNDELKEKLKMERNLVELEQKALRLQMNPHFLFNVLQSIQELIIKDDKDKARLSIAKFAKLMREILENSREQLISVEQEIDTIENYLKLEQLTKAIDFTYEINIDDEIDEDEALLPPLLIQPFVENTIIHGFKEINRPPHLIINIELENESNLLITIDDNGCGRLKSSTTKSQVDHLHKSLALQVTQERLSKLSEKDTSQKLFEIIDKEENGIPLGTTIKLRVGI